MATNEVVEPLAEGISAEQDASEHGEPPEAELAEAAVAVDRSAKVPEIDPTNPPASLTESSWLAIAGLALAGVVSAIRVVPALTFHAAIGTVGTVSEGPNPDAAHSTFSGWVTATGVVGLISVALFLPWFYMAYSNLTKLGTDELRFSSGWAIGAWFVPLLDLVRPKQMADDLWRASGDEDEDEAWWTRPISPLLNWWWGLLLIGWLMTVVGATLALIGYDNAVRENAESIIAATAASGAFKSSLTQIEAGTILNAVGGATVAAAAGIAVALVWQITQRLEVRRRRLFPEGTANRAVRDLGSSLNLATPHSEGATVESSQPDDVERRSTKRCPDCAEDILAEARACRYCGFRFDG